MVDNLVMVVVNCEIVSLFIVSFWFHSWNENSAQKFFPIDEEGTQFLKMTVCQVLSWICAHMFYYIFPDISNISYVTKL